MDSMNVASLHHLSRFYLGFINVHLLHVHLWCLLESYFSHHALLPFPLSPWCLWVYCLCLNKPWWQCHLSHSLIQRGSTWKCTKHINNKGNIASQSGKRPNKTKKKAQFCANSIECYGSWHTESYSDPELMCGVSNQQQTVQFWKCVGWLEQLFVA